ncbi:MAG: 6-phospho-3-hexuloisomerase [Thermoprotei archaeon]|nr:MAG: 6-phospho-3-hexuloisomerase [Thermoprotei archaeon]
MREIINHILHNVLPSLDKSSVEKMVEILINARRNHRKIMVVGAGRSGLVAKSFAMRLMHLGFQVYVLGETITPSVDKDDILIAVSGSGSTQIVVSTAVAAKKKGAKIISITSHPDSPLGKISDHYVVVPGRTKVSKEADYFARQVLGIYEPLAPLGTLFEDSAMIFFDGLIAALMRRLNINEEQMMKRHSDPVYIS